MIDDKTVKAYKGISAPEELRERVLNTKADCTAKKIPVFQFAAAAACFMLIFSAVLIYSSLNKPSLLLSGEKIGNAPVSVSTEASPMSRMSAEPLAASEPQLKIPLQFKKSKDVTAYVSRGTLINSDMDTGVHGKSSLKLSENGMFCWNIPYSEIGGDGAQLTLTKPGGKLVYILVPDENGNLTIALKN